MPRQLVDQAFDGVPLPVEVSVVAHGPTAPGAIHRAVSGLVLLLGDDCLDVAFAQVGPATAGRVGLVPSDRARAGTGAAEGPADPHLVEHADELRTVRGLARGQDNASGRHLRSAAR